MFRPTRAFLLLGLLASAAPAQQVWTVDDTAGTGADAFDIQTAINAAADGDTILVRAGTQSSFVIDGKSLMVAADTEAAVQVTGFRVRNLAAGQSVTIVGMLANTIQILAPGPGVEILKITDCAGPVLIQDCKFAPDSFLAQPPTNPTVTVSHAAAVTFERCMLYGREAGEPIVGIPHTAEALAASASQVQLAHCDVLGAFGLNAMSGGSGSATPATPGGGGITLSTSRLVLLGSEVRGGVGGSGTSVVGSITSGENGGAGIAFGDAASEVVMRASTVSGGAGGTGGGTPGAPGAPITGPGVVTSLPGDSQPLDITPAVAREGTAGLLQLHAAPGSAALLLLGFGQSQLWLPAHAGVLLPPAAALVVPLGAMPGSGVLALPYVVPTLPAGVEGITVVLQSAFAGGGPAVLGGSGALVIIGAGF